MLCNSIDCDCANETCIVRFSPHGSAISYPIIELKTHNFKHLERDRICTTYHGEGLGHEY